MNIKEISKFEYYKPVNIKKINMLLRINFNLAWSIHNHKIYRKLYYVLRFIVIYIMSNFISYFLIDSILIMILI